MAYSSVKETIRHFHQYPAQNHSIRTTAILQQLNIIMNFINTTNVTHLDTLREQVGAQFKTAQQDVTEFYIALMGLLPHEIQQYFVFKTSVMYTCNFCLEVGFRNVFIAFFLVENRRSNSQC
jgi:hypothetical protein